MSTSDDSDSNTSSRSVSEVESEIEDDFDVVGGLVEPY